MTEEPSWLHELKYYLALSMPGAQTFESHEAFFKMISDNISEKCDFYEVRQQFQSYVMREVLEFDRVQLPEVAEMVDRAIAHNEAGRKDRGRRAMRRKLEKDARVLIERFDKRLRESCHPDSGATPSDVDTLEQGHSALMAALSVVLRNPRDVMYHAEVRPSYSPIAKLLELLSRSSGIWALILTNSQTSRVAQSVVRNMEDEMTDTWNIYEGMSNDELERETRGGDNLLARELAKRLTAVREFAKRMDEAKDEIRALIVEMEDLDDVT